MASNSSIVTLKAIMPTVSKFDLRSVTAEVQKELENEAKYLEKQFKKTTRTWKHKPRFESITAVTGQSMELLVGTDDVIYGWVNNGTKKHPITPRNKRSAFSLPLRKETGQTFLLWKPILSTCRIHRGCKSCRIQIYRQCHCP